MPYRHDVNRQLKPDEAKSLLELADKDPEGMAALFLINAAADGWKIDFPRRNGLTPDYDENVGRGIINNTRETAASRAYGALVASSLGIELLDDGR